jgi:nitroreductase
VRRQLAELYQNPPPDRPPVGGTHEPVLPATPQQQRVSESAAYLREHMHEVPLMVVPCVEQVGGAAGWAPSIYPAVWSFLLALRSRGLGSVTTTIHLYRQDEAASILGVPDGFAQACLLPVAYYTGDDFKPAHRRPLEEVAFLDHWDRPIR